MLISEIREALSWKLGTPQYLAPLPTTLSSLFFFFYGFEIFLVFLKRNFHFLKYSYTISKKLVFFHAYQYQIHFFIF